ncbi:phage tail tape measure protein [Nocardiopsis sp. LOL_012]|uniref:phage tail tape measure protein n=1 Tax=Nocardiopsis sp. LOL_012 TaxID=3345409 RepID=UPI003A83F0F6
MATTVGAVWLNVLPSMRDFTRKLTGQATDAAAKAAESSGRRLGADLVDEASNQIKHTSAKTARQTGEKVADEVSRAATKRLPRELGKAGDAAGRALTNSMTRATNDTVDAVTKTTARTLPTAMSAQAGRAGERAGAAMSRAMAASYQPPSHGFGGWVAGAATAARQAGSSAMSALGSTITAAGPALTSTLSGAVGGAIAVASREGVAQAGAAWQRAGDSMAAAGQHTTMALTAPVAALGAVTLSTAGDYEQAMNRVRAVSGATGDEFDNLAGLARELGSTTQYSATEAADALGFLAMAGFDTDQMMAALPGTLDLAAAGAIELGEAADIASNILTGYGFDASELARVNDVLAETFTNSNVNMTMLGYSFRYIAPIASSAGLQFEEVAAAIGLLGNAGIQGEQAGTALRGAISRLLKPTGAVSETLNDLGVSVHDSSGQMLGLADIFSQLEAAGATTSDMIKIFGVEAGPGMMALLDQGADTLQGFTAELENAGGTAQTIADIQMEGLNGSLRELKSAFEELLLAVADSGLLEEVTGRVEALTGAVKDLSDTNPELLRTATTVAGLVAALGPIVWVGGRVASTVGTLTSAVSGSARFLRLAVDGWQRAGTVWAAGTPLVTRLAGAVRVSYLAVRLQAAATGRSTAAMILHNTWAKIVRGATALWTGAQWLLNAALNANPIGLVVIAVAALVGGFILAYKHSETFRGFVDGLWSSAKELFAHLEPLVPVLLNIGKTTLGIALAPLIGAFLGLRAAGRAAWRWLQPAFEWLSGFWTSTLQPKVQRIGEVFDEALGKAQTAWRLLTGLFAGDVDFADITAALSRNTAVVTGWLQERGRDVLDWVKGLPERIWEGGTGLGVSFLGLLQQLLDPATLTGIGQDIAGHITGGLDWLLGQARELPSKLRPHLETAVTAVVDWARNLPGRVEAKVSDLAGRVSGWASQVGPKIVERLQGVGEDIAGWLRELPGRIRDWVDIDATVAWLSTMKDRAVKRLGEAADSVMEWAKSLPGKIRGWIDNAAKVKDWFVEWGPKILAGLAAAILVVVLAIPALFLAVGAAILFVLGVIVVELGKWIWEKFTGLMESAASAVSAKVSAVGSRFREIRDLAVARTLELRDRVVGFFVNARDRAVGAVLGLRDRAVGFLVSARDRGVSAVRGLRDRVTGLAGNARDWVVERVAGLRDRAVGVLDDFQDKAVGAFKTAKSGIETAWQKLEQITREPIEFIVNTVYNDGIRATWNKVAGLVNMDTLPRIYGFATGGVLPGYTPGRDPHKFVSPTGGRLELSGGEAIMRPEFTRVVGSGWVHAINTAARTGGIGGVQSALGFANGGIYPGPVQAFSEGGLFQRLTDFTSTIGGIFDGDGLQTAFGAVVDPLLDTMRGRFTGGRWVDAMVGVPETMMSRLSGWLRSIVGPLMGGSGKAVAEAARNHLGISGNPNRFTAAFGMPGQPWCAMFASEMIRQAGAQDAYHQVRSPAVASFANSSLTSVYGAANSRPGDLAVYRGQGPSGWGHINIVVDSDGSTVGGNESNSVKFSTGYSARAAKFMRPTTMATGGIWGQDQAFNTPATTPPLTRLLQALDSPLLYDSGGWLMPGVQLVANRTGRPEPVLTDRQWADLRTARDQQRRERPHQTFNITETHKARSTAREVMKAQADADALHPSWA